MRFKYFLLAILIILNVKCIKSQVEDAIEIRELFIKNLLEEYRENLHQKLTNDIQQSINDRIETFMSLMNEPVSRKRRDTSEQLINEKNVEILTGFEHRGVVPVNFPQDICMFRINERSVAVGLSYIKDRENVLTIYTRINSQFHKTFHFQSRHLMKIDCHSVGNVGYIAVVNSINSTDESSEIPSSFVYRITMNSAMELEVDSMQIFPEPNQINVRLWSTNGDLFLIYTYSELEKSGKCKLYKLLGDQFNATDTLPCHNSRVIEFFSIKHETFIFLGNHPELNGTINTFSTIMRYNSTSKRFVLHQKLYTNAISVGKFFYFDFHRERQYYLFIGNSYEINEFGGINYDVPSIVYKFVNGFFVPLQTLNVMHVKDVAPVKSEDEFHLLITSQDTEVQIYYFDGWKFQESNLDFTGEAFGAGVNSMRVYDNIIEGTMTLVISNSNMKENQWNIYTPTFVMKRDSIQLKTCILKWCKDAFQRASNFVVEKSDEMLKSALNLTSETSDEVHFMGEINLNNASINLIHTNELIYRNHTLNKSKINRINSIKQRSDTMKRDIERLRQKINFADATRRVRRQVTDDVTLVKKLTVDNLNVKTVNGKPIVDLVYKKNSKNLRMNSIIAREVAIKNELFVDGKVDGIEISQENLIMNIENQVLNPLNVQKLIVKNIIPQNVNGMPFTNFHNLLKRKINPKLPNLIHELEVDSVRIDNLLNERNFTTIANFSLKSNGPQFFTSPLTVKNLKVNEVNFDKSRQVISDIPIANLIDISNGNPIEIQQSVRFEAPVEVKQLFVRNRINNVNIKDGKILVLRTTGEEQVVTGEKTFETINLLQPIVLRGKIESKSLERMNPVVSIDRNLVLRGDYVIRGPVTIQKLLNVTGDVISTNPHLGLKKLGEMGLTLNETASTNNRMVFKDVVQIKGNLNSQSINSVPISSFIKLDNNREQVVSGKKTFTKNLSVKGSIDVDVVNDVDLKRLDETVLKRNSESTQFIDGNVQIANLQVEHLTTPTAKVNGKDINLIFSKNRPQKLTELKANNIKVKSLNVNKMEQNINSKIFGNDLNFLIDDTITSESFSDTIITEKKFTNLKVKNLEFAEGNEWKDIIGNFESILQGFNITSDTTFSNEMEIHNLVVKGRINGISYEDMINNWLRMEGDQSFTAPQRFKKLTVNENIKTQSINGVDVNRLLDDAIYIDEPITLDNLQISGLLSVNTKVLSPLVNGATFNDKLILNNTQDVQYLKRVVVERETFIQHLNYSYLNDINCVEFLNIFNGYNEPAPSIKIKGNAAFNKPVNVTFLNNVNVENLYATTWLSNRDVTLTGDDIQFLDVSFIDGPLFIDSLNGRDLEELYFNYLSKSKDQTVKGNLNVYGNVYALKNFYATKTIIPKFIKIDEHTSFNITEFALKTLRHNVSQVIDGNWRVKKLIIYGNFDGIINNLNIHDDVLNARNLNQRVEGLKRIKILNVYDLEAKFINDLDVNDWLENAVKTNISKDQLINGKITFKKFVHIENNLQVFGTVNNIPISPQTVLMNNRENQVINGDVTFFILDPHTVGRISNQIFIDRLVLRGDINGRNWQEINDNVFRPDSDFINSKVVFERELHVDSILTNKSIYGTDMVEFLKGSSVSSNMMKFKKNMQHLSEIGDDLIRSLNDSIIELNHFEFVQTLNNGRDIQKSVLFSINSNYFLAIHEKNSSLEAINFYRWMRESRKFTVEPSMIPLHYNAESFQITHFYKILYRGIDHLYIEFIDQHAKTHNQNLLIHDAISGTFVRVIQTISKNSAKFFTWRDGQAPCYGLIHNFTENILVNCEGMPQTVIQAENSIHDISSQNDMLILLTEDGKVRVWRNQNFIDIPNLINPQSFSSIEFNGRIYLAVITDEIEGTIHHGDVHIFECSTISPFEPLNFKELQKLSLHVPIDVKFSKAPSDDLLLYILTRNEPRAFYVFSYAGSSNFVPSIGEDTIIKKASNLDVIQIDNESEMAAIVSGDNVYIFQAVINHF